MKILHVLAPAAVGGLERVVQMLATAQAAAGHDVTVAGVVAPGPETHPFFEPFDATGVTAVPVVVRDRAWLAEERALRAEARVRSPEIIHTHGYRADVIGGIVARRIGSPRVSTAHGFIGGGWKNRLYERLQVASYRGRAHVVAVSRRLRGELQHRGVPGGRLHAIRNGWRADRPHFAREEARAELGLEPEGRVLGWIGRLGHEKGPDVAVEALRTLPEWRLCMIGDGPMAESVREIAERVGVADRVSWQGRVPRADLLLRAFDVFVLSSRTEGTPMVILEALGAGVPIVAAEVGGIADIVRDGREALLVPSESPAELARGVQRTFEDTEATRGRVAAGRERLESEFGLEAWVKRYERVYERAIEEAGR